MNEENKEVMYGTDIPLPPVDEDEIDQIVVPVEPENN